MARAKNRRLHGLCHCSEDNENKVICGSHVFFTPHRVFQLPWTPYTIMVWFCRANRVSMVSRLAGLKLVLGLGLGIVSVQVRKYCIGDPLSVTNVRPTYTYYDRLM